VDHTILDRRIQAYAPELDKRLRSHRRMMTGSWLVHEMYVKVKRRWMYLDRAVDARRKPSPSRWAPSVMPRPRIASSAKPWGIAAYGQSAHKRVGQEGSLSECDHGDKEGRRALVRAIKA